MKIHVNTSYLFEKFNKIMVSKSQIKVKIIVDTIYQFEKPMEILLKVNAFKFIIYETKGDFILAIGFFNMKIMELIFQNIIFFVCKSMQIKIYLIFFSNIKKYLGVILDGKIITFPFLEIKSKSNQIRIKREAYFLKKILLGLLGFLEVHYQTIGLLDCWAFKLPQHLRRPFSKHRRSEFSANSWFQRFI